MTWLRRYLGEAEPTLKEFGWFAISSHARSRRIERAEANFLSASRASPIVWRCDRFG